MSDVLQAEHDRLRAMMHECASHMRLPDPCEMAGLARRRAAFAQLFRAHIARIDRDVAAMRREIAMTGQGDLVDHHARNMRDIFLAYSAHINHWTLDNVASGWAAYCAEALDMHRHYHAQLDWERSVLYPLLASCRRSAA